MEVTQPIIFFFPEIFPPPSCKRAAIAFGRSGSLSPQARRFDPQPIVNKSVEELFKRPFLHRSLWFTSGRGMGLFRSLSFATPAF